MKARHTLLAALLLGSLSAEAQTAAPAAPTKKELAARIVRLQQPAIEAMARSMAEQPAANLMERAAVVLPARVPADKREAVARDIQADARKYVDEAVPLVRDAALKLAPLTIGAILEEKFTEDELKQVIAIMESPAYAKFQQLGNDMQRALIARLVTDTRLAIEPKVKAMEQSVSARLGRAQPPAAAPAKPASR